MDRRTLGTESLTFMDGTNKSISFHAVSSFEKMKLRRQFLKQKFDANGKLSGADFQNEEYILNVICIGTDSSKLSKEEIMNIDTPDLQDLFDRYYGDLSKEKKLKLADTAELSPDNKSK